MRELRLSGLDLSEASPRLLVRFTPHLSRLDLSQCDGVTDQAVHTITSSVSPLRESLTHISLAGEELELERELLLLLLLLLSAVPLWS